MNKTLRNALLLCLSVASISACKKSDDNNNNTPPATPSITLKGITFNQYAANDATDFNFFGHTSYVLQAYNRTTDGSKYVYADLLSLANLRPTAGSYNIGGYVPAGYSANQLQLLVEDSSAAGQGLYYSDSVSTVNATVTVTGGKVSVTVPSMKMHGNYTPAGGNSYTDSIVFAGTMTVQ